MEDQEGDEDEEEEEATEGEASVEGVAAGGGGEEIETETETKTCHPHRGNRRDNPSTGQVVGAGGVKTWLRRSLSYRCLIVSRSLTQLRLAPHERNETMYRLD